MAVPKRKLSRSRTRSRRAQWKAEPVPLVTIRVDGKDIRIPRRLVRAYRTYPALVRMRRAGV